LLSDLPPAMADEMIHHMMKSNLKRISVIAWISADRKCLSIYYQSPDFESLRNGLKKRCIRFGVDSVLKPKPKASINVGLFKDSTTNVFFPNVNEVRSNQEFADREA
jgi:hypothetical protein